MSRKKAGEEPSGGGDDSKKRKVTKQVRLDPEFVRRLNVVAAGLDMEPGVYVQLKLDPIIESDLPRALRASRFGGVQDN
jgi:hypothetical protein